MTSTIKVNNIQNQCGANIINESSNTITIGASGDTVSLASGASQSGFGRSGSVDWQTSIKTSGFTAVSGEGYFCNTTSAAFTVTLPASPSVGDIVAIKDYANTFDTNTLTLGRNGSNIGGEAVDSSITTEGIAITVVYADATKGWLVVDSGLQSEAPGPKFVTATGGTVTTVCTNFKVHTFTSPGTFCVSCAGNAAGSNTVSYMVVAGGAGGGGSPTANDSGGGGGAGGFREGKASSDCYTASPLNAPAGLPVTAQGYPITVGSGGSPGPGSPGARGGSGNNSVFSTITSAGGGGGGSFPSAPQQGGGDGGSGGGGSGGNPGGACNPASGGSGNTPSVTPAQGKDGARGSSPGNGDPANYWGGGGGGATVAGAVGPASNGGTGATTNINGSPTAFSGGGGGGQTPGRPVSGGGTGGTGGGGRYNIAGTANTGGAGGGGSGPCGAGGAGGSGIVIIRYKFQ